ncbi:MAG: hypothetical protein WCI73_00530 [Phycisphaerae bacterium]
MDQEFIEKAAGHLVAGTWSRQALKGKLISERKYSDADAEAMMLEAEKVAEPGIKARVERQKIAAEKKLADAKAAEERQKVEAAQKIEDQNKAALASLAAFQSNYEKIWISAGTLDKVESVFKSFLRAEVLEKANTILCQQHHQRKLTYRDIAFLYTAHRKNVTKNKAGASPVRGIVGLSRKGMEQGLIEGEFSHVHISMVVGVFQNFKLTVCEATADHKNGQAARYRMLPHPELDNLLWN